VPFLLWFERQVRARRLYLDLSPGRLDAVLRGPGGQEVERWSVQAEQVEDLVATEHGLVLVHRGGVRRSEIRMAGQGEAERLWVAELLRQHGFEAS
jgi:hypothetical protein